jgi:hypothetical protein
LQDVGVAVGVWDVVEEVVVVEAVVEAGVVDGVVLGVVLEQFSFSDRLSDDIHVRSHLVTVEVGP